MRKIKQIIFIACGMMALTLAAFPVFAQDEKIEINKMPIKDFALNIKRQVEAGKIDLTKSFSLELEGVLTKDGKLDPKKSKFTKSGGDAAMIEVGKQFVETVSNSGGFQYLTALGIEKINFAVSQNEKQITAIVKSETATPSKAKTMASGINMMLKMAAMKSNNEDDKALLSYFNVIADDKIFVINFAAPREEVHEVLKKHLEKMTTKESSE